MTLPLTNWEHVKNIVGQGNLKKNNGQPEQNLYMSGYGA